VALLHKPLIQRCLRNTQLAESVLSLVELILANENYRRNCNSCSSTAQVFSTYEISIVLKITISTNRASKTTIKHTPKKK